MVKLTEEYDLPIAIHNHGPGDKLYGTAELVRTHLSPLPTSVGLCLDTGHVQRVGEDRWRVGVQGHGRTAEITATPGEAARQAQELYARWAQADDEAWERRAAQCLKRVPRSLMHQYWAWQLQQERLWDRGGGYLLSDLHGHRSQRLDHPQGSRLLKTDRVRATHITDALARKDKVEPPWPQAASGTGC